jgi:hypothetical protein
MGTPTWPVFLGTGMFGIGGLFAALGISSDKALMACDGLVFMVVGALTLVNAASARVRAEPLQRIDNLERRLSDKGDT